MEPIESTRELLDQLAAQGSPGLGDLLTAMSRAVEQIVPECVGLSLGLVEEGLVFTVVASSEVVAGLDAMQYLDGGPCVAGAHEGTEIDIDMAVLDEDVWRLYGEASAAMGVASSLTLPIMKDDLVIGSVNLYGSTPDAFHDRQDELAAVLGSSAENAISNADLSFRSRLAAAEGPDRLAELDLVNIAVGILVAHQAVDPGTARERLRLAAARAGLTETQAARVIRHILVPSNGPHEQDG